MKKKYLAPTSASINVTPIVMAPGSVQSAADLTPGGNPGITPACAPGRKVYI